MSVDPYALCPCGSGKKLKFCCSDLVADIEKIHKMVEGDQPRAALQHAQQTLKKRPGRPSLLDLKAMLEVTLGKLDDADRTVAELLEKDPQNPAAHAQHAILKCAQGDGRAGVEPLQRALSLIEENMPRRVLEAIGAVGHTLLVEGNVVAARAHLWLYQGIAGKEDTRALELLTRLNQVPGLPLLLRDHLYMHEAPEGHPAEHKHNYAQALAARGQWGPASVVFDKLCVEHPDLATLHYNRALVHGWLGEAEAFTAALHEYARQDVPLDDAFEAEAIAQLIDPEASDRAIEVVKLTYPILDEEETTARLSRDPLFASMPVDSEEFAEEEGPPPSGASLILDRAAPETGVDIKREDVPRVLGTLLQYGRQTNHAERLEVLLERGADYEQAKSCCEQNLQGVVGVAEEEVVGETDPQDDVLRWRWHFPTDTPPKLRMELMREETVAAITQRWPETPLASLGKKTPQEAAADPALRIQLMAAVMILEQAPQSLRNSEAFSTLRDKLGLPQPEPIESDSVDWDRLPLSRMTRVDLTSVADEDVLKLYQRGVLANAGAAIRHAAQEIVRRPSMEEKLNVDEAYHRLAILSDLETEAYDIIAQARDRCAKLGVSDAAWDLQEFEMRLIHDDKDRSNELLKHISQEHSKEPGVGEHLYQLFYQLGAIGPDGELGGMPMAPEAAAPDEPNQIWTPDADQPGGGSQKLWTPG